MRTNTVTLLAMMAVGLASGCGGHSNRSTAGSTTGGSTTGTTGTGGTGTGSTAPLELEVLSGPENKGLLRASTPVAGVVVGQLRLRSQTDVTLNQFSLTADGTVNEATGLGDTLAYVDTNHDGALDAGDVQLGNGQAVASNNGVVTFSGLTVPVSVANPIDVLVVTEIRGTANVGDTVSFKAEGWRMSAVGTGGSTPAPVVGAGTTGLVQVIGTDPAKTVNVVAAPNNPTGNVSVTANAVNVPALALRLSSTTGDVDLHGMSFRLTGSGDDAADVLSARLGRDANTNGQIDATETVISRTVPSEDDANLTFNFGGQRLYSGSGYDLVLELTLSGTATAGATFSVDLTSAGVTAHNYYGNGGTDVTLGASPVAGATLQVGSAAPSVVAKANNAAARVTSGGQELALALELTTGGIAADLNTLRVSARGSVNDTTGINGVSLYLDSDGDGAFTAGTDTLLAGPANFTTDDGQVTFTLTSAQSMAAASTTTVLVTADVAAGLTAGSDFTLSVDPSAGDLGASQPVAQGNAQQGTLLIAGAGNSAFVQPNADLGKDAYLRGEGLYLNDNFGRHNLAVGDRASGQLGERLTYVEFPLPTLPAGATPTRAYVAFYLANTAGLTGASLDVQVFRVIDSSNNRTPWVEGRGGLDASADGICFNGVSQATNRSDLTHPDVDPTVVDEVQIAAGSHGRWVLFEVTGAVQQWYAGTAPNHGLRFRDKDFATHNDGAVSFYSSDSYLAGRRPMLIVEH